MRPLSRISGSGRAASRYGLEEAIFLDSIMFWYKENRANGRNFRDGRWWTYNSISALAQMFPWWSVKQLRRIAESCREKGAILAEHYNENQRDRTLWYTPSDELLELYGADQTGVCICPNGQMELPKQANGTAQMGKCNIEHVINHVETHEDIPRESEGLPSEPGNAPKGPDEASAVFDRYAGEDRELRERLEEFREERKRRKKPLHTHRAAVVLAGKLDRLSAGDRAVKLALLDNAILHGWDSVYPLKEDGRTQPPLRGEGVTYT